MKISKKHILIVKFLVSVSIITVIFYDLDREKLIYILDNADIKFIFLSFMLLPVNLFLQFIKWKYLIYRVAEGKVPAKNILTSVFLGISFGFITPGKVGELGKLFVIQNVNRIKLLSMSILEKIYDIFPVLIFGCLSIPFLPNLFFNHYAVMHLNLFIICFIFISVVLFVGLHPGFFKSIVRYIKNNLLKKSVRFDHFLEGIESFTPVNSKMLLTFSSMLFITYTSQFVLLIYAFGKISISSAFAGVWSSILIKTFLPISLGDIGVREGTAAYVFSLFEFSKEAAVSAGFVLFVINILIPSAASIFLIPFARFMKGYLKNGKDKHHLKA